MITKNSIISVTLCAVLVVPSVRAYGDELAPAIFGSPRTVALGLGVVAVAALGANYAAGTAQPDTARILKGCLKCGTGALYALTGVGATFGATMFADGMADLKKNNTLRKIAGGSYCAHGALLGLVGLLAAVMPMEPSVAFLYAGVRAKGGLAALIGAGVGAYGVSRFYRLHQQPAHNGGGNNNNNNNNNNGGNQ